MTVTNDSSRLYGESLMEKNDGEWRVADRPRMRAQADATAAGLKTFWDGGRAPRYAPMKVRRHPNPYRSL
jgi:hypothetical protein